MSFKCPICSRTFSRRTAYTQHVQVCIKNVEVEDDDDVEMNTEGDQNSDQNSDDIEVICYSMLFLIRLLSLKKSTYQLYQF